MTTCESRLTIAAVTVDHINALGVILAWVADAFVDIGHARFTSVSGLASAGKVVHFVRADSAILTRLDEAFVFFNTLCVDKNATEYN